VTPGRQPPATAGTAGGARSAGAAWPCRKSLGGSLLWNGAKHRSRAGRAPFGRGSAGVSRALQKPRRSASYIYTLHRRTRASRPAAGCAASAIGGSEDGRASLYGDGLVRVGLDGPAADRVSSRSRSGSCRTLTTRSHSRRCPIDPPRTTRHTAESGQKERRVPRQEVFESQRQEGGRTDGAEVVQEGVQEDRQALGPEVRREGRHPERREEGRQAELQEDGQAPRQEDGPKVRAEGGQARPAAVSRR
jgi:hypothetical protein